MTKILGPVPCLSCRQPVWWDRVGPALRLMQGRGRYTRPHSCLCGSWMPHAKERCARKAGHGNEHRTRYALDNAAWTRREGYAAA